MKEITLGKRKIGPGHPPLVIAEIGINHAGSFEKAVHMIEDAAAAGCECAKFQCHVVADEMSEVARDVIPGHTTESIWEIMERCAFDENQERELKKRVEAAGMIYLSTPFSRAAANRLESMDVCGYKIGSGECNNYPLIRHVASFAKPVILSTGMNDISTIRPAVEILRAAGVPFALTHCSSLYPTPYAAVRLGALGQLAAEFPDAPIGLSDHSLGNYCCFAAVALGASILEKHFTSDRAWPGPDIELSMTPDELAELVRGSRAIHEALGGTKSILPEEQPTIDFAYACVVATEDIAAGDEFGSGNIWVKRPGTGEIKAVDYEKLFGRRATRAIRRDEQIGWRDVE